MPLLAASILEWWSRYVLDGLHYPENGSADPPLCLDQLSKLISPSADLSNAISTLSPSSFDPKNQYASVLHAVRAAAVEREPNADQTAVDIKVYRVELSSTKLEYWILALGGPESRLVGLRAKAVES